MKYLPTIACLLILISSICTKSFASAIATQRNNANAITHADSSTSITDSLSKNAVHQTQKKDNSALYASLSAISGLATVTALIALKNDTYSGSGLRIFSDNFFELALIALIGVVLCPVFLILFLVEQDRKKKPAKFKQSH